MSSIFHGTADSLREAFLMFWQTLWALVLGFALSGAVQNFVTRGQMERVLGRRSVGSLTRATLLGAASSSCSYAAAAMGKSLFQKGADFVAAMVFMLASTNLVIELGVVLALLIGWQFTASEVVGGVVMIGLFALGARLLLPDALVEAARARVRGGADSDGEPHERHAAVASDQGAGGDLAGGGHPDAGHQAGDHHHHGALPEAPSGPLAHRLRSRAEWADAAGYAIADVTMLRRELVLGFGIAGFLAALVPESAWNAIFVSGHGVWSSLENAFVGPLIAILSFVCSIGNVPLAAALWRGGINFGGVVSFIFADLITMPLLLIYRRYYGAALTLRLAALLWLVMALGGLIVEGLFTGTGLVPSTRPAEIVPDGIGWDHTASLNLIAIAVAGLGVWLRSHRERLGGGDRYATDPVCGMQVERANAPARWDREVEVLYFCSEGCRDHHAERVASA